jgi:hypothetical protein
MKSLCVVTGHKTVIIGVLPITTDLDPHRIKWLWFGYGWMEMVGLGWFLERFGIV